MESIYIEYMWLKLVVIAAVAFVMGLLGRLD